MCSQLSNTRSSALRRVVPRVVRALLRRVFVRQFQFGISPMDLRFLSDEVSYSAGDRKWDTRIDGGVGGWLAMDNHSHGYHGLLLQWCTAYGLGDACLLVSETREVGAQFRQLNPSTEVVTTDYYLHLAGSEKQADVVWDLYDAIPAALSESQFGSVLCQATFEHLLDPIGVLRKFATLLAEGGHLYLHTHTPLYGYHGWPRDYLRYFPDWFRDVTMVIPDLSLVELHCVEGHAFAAYRKVRLPSPHGDIASSSRSQPPRADDL